MAFFSLILVRGRHWVGRFPRAIAAAVPGQSANPFSSFTVEDAVRRWRLVLLCVVFVAFGIQGWIAPPLAAAERRPNLLLILADDMGYGDLGCMGSELLLTPHLDALASSGVLCEQAYVASAVCSPSRAGLLTGRDPRRFGYEGNLNKADAGYATRPELLGLPGNEHTLGDHLGAAGYATCLVGKWHQGTGQPFHPNRRGFDHFCGMLGGGHGYFPEPGKNQLERNGEPLNEFSSPYLTDFFTDEALQWLQSREANAAEQPWFLYLSYNAPHTPMQATEADLAVFEHIKDPRRRTYAAMVYALDRGVGRVIEYLDQHSLREKTLVVFLSDNGGATSNGSWNGPLSGAKGSLREGGVRVPTLYSWPSRLPAKSRYRGVVSSLDLLPTFMSAADAKPLPLQETLSHQDRKNHGRASKEYGDYDGIDLLPLLDAEQPEASRRLFWRLQGQAAVLKGANKLMRPSHRPAQLFQPATDLAESKDLAGQDAETLGSLFQELADWESSLTTVPLWDSSPYWSEESAQIYDRWVPKAEPR
ncbi:sulfatase-like hydrolase/transferase [Novipirellula artificiosorum]|uniref:Arylsulfatase n=1 Tax=Novipirellula artificiosorum TaxID=2528016 RepID=A0A5C6DVB4_9BACT|nr:sulfatase-like hydrolase/transferase [Novipirellula artificiosorum]TWU40542.1 Arylsulfatase [Novipirellula artificiosorum]